MVSVSVLPDPPCLIPSFPTQPGYALSEMKHFVMSAVDILLPIRKSNTIRLCQTYPAHDIHVSRFLKKIFEMYNSALYFIRLFCNHMLQ